jgi:hypothetical protein
MNGYVCDRCRETVSEADYRAGVPPVAGTPVVQESIEQIPVFVHGAPTLCHPIPIGMANGGLRQRVVTVGGHSGVPWAPGRRTDDHGCRSCQEVATALHDTAESLRIQKRKLQQHEGLQPPPVSQPPAPSTRSLALAVYFLLAAAALIGLTLAGGGMTLNTKVVLVGVWLATLGLSGGAILVSHLRSRTRWISAQRAVHRARETWDSERDRTRKDLQRAIGHAEERHTALAEQVARHDASQRAAGSYQQPSKTHRVRL